MIKLNKAAAVLAIAAFASVAGAQEIHNWRNATGDVWKNATGQCWRDATWTPATAAAACDGAIAAPAPVAAAPAATPAPAVAPAPVAAPAAPVTAAAPKVAAAAPAATKVTYAADAFFDFDKSVLKPEGKAKLDDLAGKLKGISLEVIIAVGHTDS